MAEALKLEILTPQRRVLAVETASVIVPGEMGELGILSQHVPLVTTLGSGVLRYDEGGQMQSVAVHYGYAQVEGDRVAVLSEMAEPAESIDTARARAAEEKARQRLAELQREAGEEDDVRLADKFTAKLQRALVRQQAGR